MSWEVVMECTYRPRLGQVVLIESDITDPEQQPVSAVVAGVSNGRAVLEITCSSSAPADGARVVTSHFAPEALYRMTATVRSYEPGFVVLDDCDHLETIQRRRWPRRAAALPVTLVCPDAATALQAETIDIGIGGTQVRTHGRLPGGADPLLALTLPAGERLLISARVVATEEGGDWVGYRLAFPELDDVETAQLADLIRHAPAVASVGGGSGSGSGIPASSPSSRAPSPR